MLEICLPFPPPFGFLTRVFYIKRKIDLPVTNAEITKLARDCFYLEQSVKQISLLSIFFIRMLSLSRFEFIVGIRPFLRTNFDWRFGGGGFFRGLTIDAAFRKLHSDDTLAKSLARNMPLRERAVSRRECVRKLTSNLSNAACRYFAIALRTCDESPKL